MTVGAGGVALMAASLMLAIMASRLIVKALLDRHWKAFLGGVLLFLVSLSIMLVALYR